MDRRLERCPQCGRGWLEPVFPFAPVAAPGVSAINEKCACGVCGHETVTRTTAVRTTIDYSTWALAQAMA